MKRFKTGQKVKATITANDSFFKEVVGIVETVKNGFVEILTERVVNKFSDSTKEHRCTTSARLENVEAI